ncbi:stage ii sporulation protein e (spoiie) [Lucifera butyrica]|uniref:Stage ii sporulation protein e (Spoiie) n=1 Tax=Lucifera butyrica TaxID=1351585 RepID=A0A498R488_9FIRM|nr:SpoIIE family protein phosphatase [Lucifera butyrica]VBB05969.1 stage ii sporulation protein e (spoiie) [Lucifera butyrica]
MKVGNMQTVTAAEIFATFCEHCNRFELLDMINDPLLLTEAATGRVLFMNEKARSLYGYTKTEPEQLFIGQIYCEAELMIGRMMKETIKAAEEGHIYTAYHQKKDGSVFKVQVNSKCLKFHGTEVLASLIRNITDDLRIREEVMMAGKIQKRLLPLDFVNDRLAMRTIYEPYYHVSGDLYDYSWDEERQCFSGYLADVTGHGLATALQTAALKALFRQAWGKRRNLTDRLQWLNREMMPYFTEECFAAAILFEVDCRRNQLIYTSAGINFFLVRSGKTTRVVRVPGPFLGILDEVDFEQHSHAYEPGDLICFLSDGLFELLPRKDDMIEPAGQDLFSRLEKLIRSPDCRDDATAILLAMK